MPYPDTMLISGCNIYDQGYKTQLPDLVNKKERKKKT